MKLITYLEKRFKKLKQHCKKQSEWKHWPIDNISMYTCTGIDNLSVCY